MAEAKLVIGAVDQTKAAFDSARRNMASLSDQASRLTLAMGPVGLALTAITAAFTGASLGGVIQVMDQLDAMSERTGISVEALSSLRVAAQLSDTSMEALAVGLKKLSSNMADAVGGSKEAQAKFASMGITPEQLASFKTADQLFSVLADKFKNYEDGANKNALATDLMGKRGEELIGTLNKGSKGLADMAEEAKKLGVVFSGQLAKEASDLNDNMERIKLAAEGAKQGLLESLLPALVRITSELIEGRKAFGGWLSYANEMGLKRNPFDSYSDSAKTATFNASLLQAQIKQLESGQRAVNETAGGAAFVGPSGSNKAATNAIRLAALKESLAQEIKREQYFNKLGLDNLKNESERLEDIFNFKRKDQAPVTKKAAPKEKAETDPGIQILNRLTKEYEGLTVAVSIAAQAERELAALKEPVTAQRRQEIMSMAELVEAQMRSAAAAKNLADMAVAELEARERLETAYDASFTALEKLASEQQFELTLLGQSTAAIAAARFEREQSNQAREAEAKLVALGLQAGYDENRMYEERAKITRELTDRAKAFAAIQRDEAAQRLDEHAKIYDANRGMQQAIQDYQLELSKAGDLMRNNVTSALKSFEDQTVSLFRKGKFDAEAFFDTILDGLVRMQVQQRIMQPLSATVGNFLSGQGGTAGGGIGDLLGGFKNLLSGGASGAGTDMFATTAAGNELGIAGASVAGGTSGIAAAMPYVGGAIAAYSLAKSLGVFGSDTEKETAKGLRLNAGAGGVSGTSYSQWSRAGGLFNPGSSGENRTALDTAQNQALSDTFSALRSNAIAFADVLGLGSDSIKGFSKDLDLALSGDAAANQRTIAAAMAGLGDDLAAQVLGKTTKTSRTVTEAGPDVWVGSAMDGSGYATTLEKLVEDVTYTASEWARAGETANQTLTRLGGSLIAANTAFDLLHHSLGATGIAGADMASKLVDAMGGLESFAAKTGNYYAQYYSAEEKLANQRRTVNAELLRLTGGTVDTRAELRRLVEQQDLSTEAGRNMYANLVNVSGAFDSMASASEQAASAMTSLTNSLLDEVRKIRGELAGDSSQGLAYAQAKFAIATGQARSGDKAALEALPELSRTLLTLSAGNATTALELARARAYAADSLETTGAALGGKIPSYAVGVGYVPADGLAYLHQGESVLTRSQNQDGKDALVAEVRALRAEVAVLNAVMRQTAENTKNTTDILQGATRGGLPLQTVAA